PRRQVPAFVPSLPVLDIGAGIESITERAQTDFTLHLHGGVSDMSLGAIRQLLQDWADLCTRGAFGGRLQYFGYAEAYAGTVVWRIAWGEAEIDAYYDLLHGLEELAMKSGSVVERLEIQRASGEERMELPEFLRSYRRQEQAD